MHANRIFSKAASFLVAAVLAVGLMSCDGANSALAGKNTRPPIPKASP